MLSDPGTLGMLVLIALFQVVVMTPWPSLALFVQLFDTHQRTVWHYYKSGVCGAYDPDEKPCAGPVIGLFLPEHSRPGDRHAAVRFRREGIQGRLRGRP